MKNVLVVFGGKSVEHDISIITGLGVTTNLSCAYNIIPVYIDKQGDWWTGDKLCNVDTFKNWDAKGLRPCAILPNKPYLRVFNKFGSKQILIYCAVNCLHGHNGEDGATQGLLRLSNIPSTSPSVLSNAICMDKTMTKRVLDEGKVKTVDYITFDKQEYKTQSKILLKKIETKIGYPCIVKPNSLGSSIGVNVVNNLDELQKSIELVFRFDKEALIEKYLKNARELNIALWEYGDELLVSNVEEVCLSDAVYNFDDKYKSKNTVRMVPAKINDTLLQQINKIATKAYKLLKCSGIVRFDFLYCDESLYLNEVNTIPGSLACYLWKEPKISYNNLLSRLSEDSVVKYNQEQNLTFSFENHVLDNLVKDNFKMTK